jgi:hypothetical protein
MRIEIEDLNEKKVGLGDSIKISVYPDKILEDVKRATDLLREALQKAADELLTAAYSYEPIDVDTPALDKWTLEKSKACANCGKAPYCYVVSEFPYGFFCSWTCLGEYHEKEEKNG